MSTLTRFVLRLLPRSIAARGLCLIIVTVVGVALPTFIGHHRLRRADAARSARERETLLTFALAAFLETNSRSTASDRAWLEPLCASSENVRWAGVFAPDGRCHELYRRTALPGDEIRAQLDLHAATVQQRLTRVEGSASSGYELVTVPCAADGLVLAIVRDPVAPLPVVSRWELVAWAGTGGLALAAAVMLLYFGIHRPVVRLHSAVGSARSGLDALARTDDVPRELAEIVQSVAAVQADVEHWRKEAANLRETMDARVARRTQEARAACLRAEREAGTDPLTRLGNRRLLEQQLPALCSRHRVFGAELSLVLLDVDHFKLLNDTRGHAAGDALLSFLGDLIRGTLRKGVDLAVRFGGDEFVLVLPDTTASDASRVAERIASLFAQRAATFGSKPAPGLSAGIAALRQHGINRWETLLEMADAAMYWAKRAGRSVGTVSDARALRAENRAPT